MEGKLMSKDKKFARFSEFVCFVIVVASIVATLTSCGPHEPVDLAPVKFDDTHTYCKISGPALIVRIQNQGRDFSVDTTTEVVFKTASSPTDTHLKSPTGTIPPDEYADVLFILLHNKTNGYETPVGKVTITADADDNQPETNEENNTVSGICDRE
jgi:hypothetical protein